MENKIIISNQFNVELVKENDIIYFRAEGSYCIIIHVDNKSYRMTKNMKKTFEMIKDKLSFIKIHRSLIVNLKYVKKIERDLGNSYKWVLILQNDERLPISLLSKAELILRFKIKYNH